MSPKEVPCFILLECSKHVFLSRVAFFQPDSNCVKYTRVEDMPHVKSYHGLNLDFIKNMFRVMG